MLFSFGFSACSEEEDYKALHEKETKIKVKIYTNSEEAPVNITGAGIDKSYITIKKYWENTYVTKAYSTGFTANCADKTVLLTGEFYVNGTLVKKTEGNGRIAISKYVKGDLVGSDW